MQGDMEPEMPSDFKSIAVTRRGDGVLQVTPCQLQNSRDALLHEASTPAGPEIWDLKQSRSCRSFSVSSLIANGRLRKIVDRQNQTRPEGKAPKHAISSVWLSFYGDGSMLCNSSICDT
uniref:Uncharacterized protein n=1 Tax=Oryza brachyantha TaxID=4533 RepID=J3MFD2_ORYBR